MAAEEREALKARELAEAKKKAENAKKMSKIMNVMGTKLAEQLQK